MRSPVANREVVRMVDEDTKMHQGGVMVRLGTAPARGWRPDDVE